MSTYTDSHQKRGYGGTDVHHSKDDALSEREYELLLEGAHELGEYHSLEARLIVLVAGRLGLRSGEIVHMRESWLDRRRRMLVIPGDQPCTKGRGGGICGSCRQAARQMAEHNDGVTEGHAAGLMWQPKTAAAAREVPFDVSPRAELVLERYFDRFDRFQSSQSAVGRRVKRSAQAANELDAADIYPHCLRATAATRYASRGLNVIALQSMMGWANLQTAQNYIRRSGEQTAKAIRDIQL